MSEIEQLEQMLESVRAIPIPRDPSPFENVLMRMARDAEELKQLLRPEIRVEPTFTVEAAPPAEVRVNVPDQSQAIDALAAVLTDLLAAISAIEPNVTVNLPKFPVEVTLTEQESGPVRLRIEFQRNQNGSLKSATVTED